MEETPVVEFLNGPEFGMNRPDLRKLMLAAMIAVGMSAAAIVLGAGLPWSLSGLLAAGVLIGSAAIQVTSDSRSIGRGLDAIDDCHSRFESVASSLAHAAGNSSLWIMGISAKLRTTIEETSELLATADAVRKSIDALENRGSGVDVTTEPAHSGTSRRLDGAIHNIRADVSRLRGSAMRLQRQLVETADRAEDESTAVENISTTAQRIVRSCRLSESLITETARRTSLLTSRGHDRPHSRHAMPASHPHRRSPTHVGQYAERE